MYCAGADWCVCDNCGALNMLWHYSICVMGELDSVHHQSRAGICFKNIFVCYLIIFWWNLVLMYWLNTCSSLGVVCYVKLYKVRTEIGILFFCVLIWEQECIRLCMLLAHLWPWRVFRAYMLIQLSKNNNNNNGAWG